jgi:predicted Zn finger-like uncharacterized protein
MILTCPECATSYFVDDSRIAGAGRTVKCSSCGARWTARRDVDPDAAETEAQAPAAEPDDSPPPTAPARPEDLEIVVEPRESRARRPAAARAVAAPKREAMGKVMIWAVSAAVVVALVFAAVVLRDQVVRLWPASQAAYAGLGLPVNDLGLVVEGVKIEPTFQGERPVLAVSGAIRNLRDHPTEAPPVRMKLLDQAGKTLAIKVARPLNAGVPAHATRYFSLAIVDPPAGIHDLRVAFDPIAKPASPKHD